MQEDWYPPQWEASRGTPVKLGSKQLHGKILLTVPASAIGARHPRRPGRVSSLLVVQGQAGFSADQVS